MANLSFASRFLSFAFVFGEQDLDESEVVVYNTGGQFEAIEVVERPDPDPDDFGFHPQRGRHG